ncbi:hypothetical protein [Hymenobacter crusticola]|uniref:Uncharacterized protein n=1 Tax=Hymenobacter crusticola TaxID=1770526 RepID=A0A243W832_9BACT|nr:hypothetical protein [Hymenobacter crusticola]OUJ71241.1 hypothetical protein BXP70_22450 [Hymenobacter crusticola]
MPTDCNTPEYRWELAARIANSMLGAGLSHRDINEATTCDDLLELGELPKPEVTYLRSLILLADHEARELFTRHARGKATPEDPAECTTFNFFRQLVWISLYSRPDGEDGLPV